MVVRKLSEHDLNALWTLRLQALIDNPEVFDASYEETVAYGNEWLLERLRQGDETFYLGGFEETLIGMIGLRREEGIKTQHKGHIFGLYVLPERRGKGVGKALMILLLH